MAEIEKLENATAEPVDLVAIERLFAHRYSPDQQLKVESVLPSGMTHPPFFVDAHPIKKVPLQLIVHEAEFDTTTDALAWLETAPGKVFKMHADYVTVLFTGA